MHSIILAINYLLNLSASRFKLHGRTTLSHFEYFSCRLYYSVTIEPFCGNSCKTHRCVTVTTTFYSEPKATEPAFNCFAATETAISDHKRHNYILIFSIQLKQKCLYRVNVHLCQYELLLVLGKTQRKTWAPVKK